MIYENCNGKIGSNGLCEKCLQPSETTSVYCLRLIPIPFPSAPGEKSEGEDAASQISHLQSENKTLRKEKGMRWVKASNKEPPLKTDLCCRILKDSNDELCYCHLIYLGENRYERRYPKDRITIKPSEIEYLSESTDQSQISKLEAELKEKEGELAKLKEPWTLFDIIAQKDSRIADLEKELELYKCKTEFYRETTERVRELVSSSKDIGRPCQALYDAIADHVQSQSATITKLREGLEEMVNCDYISGTHLSCALIKAKSLLKGGMKYEQDKL
jgi:chromosome segregation ATPase